MGFLQTEKSRSLGWSPPIRVVMGKLREGVRGRTARRAVPASQFIIREICEIRGSIPSVEACRSATLGRCVKFRIRPQNFRLTSLRLQANLT